MSARLAEEQRRRRDRRDARARAYREYVCGGELVDAFAPVLSGGSDEQHRRFVRKTMIERVARAQAEADRLAYDFARRCWLTRAEADRMIGGYYDLIASVPPPEVPAYNSTSPAVPTTGTHGGTIPAL